MILNDISVSFEILQEMTIGQVQELEKQYSEVKNGRTF